MKKLGLFFGLSLFLFSCSSPLDKSYNPNSFEKDMTEIKNSVSGDAHEMLKEYIDLNSLSDPEMLGKTYRELLEDTKKWHADLEEKKLTATWPPIPKDFRGDFTMDMATMNKLAGDAIALPIGGQFKTLSILTVEESGTAKLKDLYIDANLDGHPFQVTIHALHSHDAEDAKGDYRMGDPGEAKVAWVWHDFHVQAPGANALHIVGAYEDGKLVGYTYNQTELVKLTPGSLLPIFGETGWQVVKIDEPLDGEMIWVAGNQRLILLDVGEGRVGLVPLS